MDARDGEIGDDELSQLKPFAFARYVEGRAFDGPQSHSLWR